MPFHKKMAGRKRKFPANYIVPYPPQPEDEDEEEIADLSEAREQHDSLQERHNDSPEVRSEDPTLSDHHEAHGEHGVSNEDIGNLGDISTDESGPEVPDQGEGHDHDDEHENGMDISDPEIDNPAQAQDVPNFPLPPDDEGGYVADEEEEFLRDVEGKKKSIFVCSLFFPKLICLLFSLLHKISVVIDN